MAHCLFFRGLLVAVAVIFSSPVMADDLVGKMGQFEIRVSDLNRLLGEGKEVRPSGYTLSELDKIVRTELVRQALLSEAKAKGLDKKPEILNQMERAKEQALVNAYMNGTMRPPADYPSDDDVKVAYEAGKNAFAVPAKYLLAQIYIAVPQDADAATVASSAKNAEEIWKKTLGNTVDFSGLAKGFSQHEESAKSGGEMGWLAEDQLIPEVRDTVLSLAKGQVSKPVRSSQGWHIIKLMDMEVAGVRPFSEVRDYIVRVLRLRKAEENEKAYLDSLLAKNPVVINEIVLSKINGRF